MGTLDYAARIELDTAAQSNGLALMVTDLILQILKEHPGKREDFARLRGRVAIVAEDAEVAMTLHFEGNMLTVYDGIEGIPDVTVRACGEDIVQLSLLSMTKLGLPDLRGEAGRALMQKTQS